MKKLSAEEYVAQNAARFGIPIPEMERLFRKAHEVGPFALFAKELRAIAPPENLNGVNDHSLEQLCSIYRKKLNGLPTRAVRDTIPTPPPVVGQVGIHLARYSKLQEQEHELEIKLAEVRREIERYRPIKGLVESLGRAVSQLTEPEKT